MKIVFSIISIIILFNGCSPEEASLGKNEPIRVYLEFDDGMDRGWYNPGTTDKGFPDENYDATTAVAVTWHRMPEENKDRNSRLLFRMVHPKVSGWKMKEGTSFPFWLREEWINRVILKELSPNSVYEVRFNEKGRSFHFRTMPSRLEDRKVKIAVASDLQTSEWKYPASDNARMIASLHPDLFISVGDLLSSDGDPNSEKESVQWARFLDNLYGTDNGCFFYDLEIDGKMFPDVIIPFVTVVGNHDAGGQLMHPRDVNTTGTPRFPEFTGPNWLELLFHFPFGSEGFNAEFGPDHPNMDKSNLIEGFNKGGFGSLSFGDYLLILSLNNIQFWEGEPDNEFLDWQGKPIVETWPWYGEIQCGIRQDQWLEKTMSRKPYTHILPFYHRGLFGGARLNMSHKNRDILKYWLPLFQKHNVRYITEAHDHMYVRTVPFFVSDEKPRDTYMDRMSYEPLSWKLTNVPDDYLDRYFTVNCIRELSTEDIIGWEYDGKYVTSSPEGMIVNGCGGWAAGRRGMGDRQAGNAGWWFVDKDKGGEIIDGQQSYYVTLINLTTSDISVESYHSSELHNIDISAEIKPFSNFRWSMIENKWQIFNEDMNTWTAYSSSYLDEPTRKELK